MSELREVEPMVHEEEPASATLTDEDIETRRVGLATPSPRGDTGDDSGDTSDTGDDSGDTGDPGDAGDTGDVGDTGDDSGDSAA